uniref:rRNA-processing protein UTP23 homolog n=1 Tax=Trichuris muris TaxID=70415 RepID=A0A5S6R4L7_TRIMR
MPQSRRKRLLDFAKQLARCSSAVSAYGKCVSKHAESISKDVCAEQFLALVRCVSKVPNCRFVTPYFASPLCVHVSERMKVRRLKKAQRVLNFLRNNYDFVRPYRLLVDGTFCQHALENKINLREQLTKYLQGEVIINTTSCVLDELELLGKHFRGAWLIAKQFKLARCRHAAARNNPFPASQCLRKLIGKKNKRKYMVATQDPEFRDTVKENVLVCPFLLIHHKSIIFDHLSKRCKVAAQRDIEAKLNYEDSKETIDKLKREAGVAERPPKPERPRRRPKGPNPLSCKKKKKKSTEHEHSSTKQRGRSRRRRQRGRPTVDQQSVLSIGE